MKNLYVKIVGIGMLLVGMPGVLHAAGLEGLRKQGEEALQKIASKRSSLEELRFYIKKLEEIFGSKEAIQKLSEIGVKVDTLPEIGVQIGNTVGQLNAPSTARQFAHVGAATLNKGREVMASVAQRAQQGAQQRVQWTRDNPKSAGLALAAYLVYGMARARAGEELTLNTLITPVTDVFKVISYLTSKAWNLAKRPFQGEEQPPGWIATRCDRQDIHDPKNIHKMVKAYICTFQCPPQDVDFAFQLQTQQDQSWFRKQFSSIPLKLPKGWQITRVNRTPSTVTVQLDNQAFSRLKLTAPPAAIPPAAIPPAAIPPAAIPPAAIPPAAVAPRAAAAPPAAVAPPAAAVPAAPARPAAPVVRPVGAGLGIERKRAAAGEA